MKPKLDKQFSSAEKNGVPFAVVLGEDEMKEGKVKVKELGLPEGHPEKNGVDVELGRLVEEIKRRIEEKREMGGVVEGVEGVVLEGVKEV